MDIRVSAEINDQQTEIWVNLVQLAKAVYNDDQTKHTCDGCLFGENCETVYCAADDRKDNMNITWRAV